MSVVQLWCTARELQVGDVVVGPYRTHGDEDQEDDLGRGYTISELANDRVNCSYRGESAGVFQYFRSDDTYLIERSVQAQDGKCPDCGARVPFVFKEFKHLCRSL